MSRASWYALLLGHGEILDRQPLFSLLLFADSSGLLTFLGRYADGLLGYHASSLPTLKVLPAGVVVVQIILTGNKKKKKNVKGSVLHGCMYTGTVCHHHLR